MTKTTEPVAFLYTDEEGGRVACVEQIEPPFEGWTETPLYTHPAPSPDVAGLVERVREMGEHPCRSELPMGADLREAATTLATLSAENERYRELLHRSAEKIYGLTGDFGSEDNDLADEIRAALETKHD